MDKYFSYKKYLIIKIFLVQVDGKKKKRSAKDEIFPSSDEEAEVYSETEDEEEAVKGAQKKVVDNDYRPDSETDDDGTDSEQSGEEDEECVITNAERASALLKEKNAAQTQKEKKEPKKNENKKVTPIKIKELAMASAAKRQKIEKEKPKTPKKTNPKKKSKVEKDEPMDLSRPSTSAQNNGDGVMGTISGPQNQQGEEKSFDVGIIEKKKTREAPIFNDKNLDYNLFSNDPDNVVSKKIKISSNVIVQCKMIDGLEKGKNATFQDYAALSFLRKTKDEKAFEFNLPLGLATNIIEALKLIINDNPKFFKKYKD